MIDPNCERKPRPSGRGVIKVTFTIPGPAVGKNAAYMRLRKDVVTSSGRRMGLILSPQGRSYKNLVYQIGLIARNASDWPNDVWTPKNVRITVAMYGTRHDTGAATQLIKDGIEGIFYQNDRVVRHGPEGPSIRDGSPARVEVTLELLESYTPEEARKRQSESQARLLRKQRKE